jgi:hypothetical protein
MSGSAQAYLSETIRLSPSSVTHQMARSLRSPLTHFPDRLFGEMHFSLSDLLICIFQSSAKCSTHTDVEEEERAHSVFKQRFLAVPLDNAILEVARES